MRNVASLVFADDSSTIRVDGRTITVHKISSGRPNYRTHTTHEYPAVGVTVWPDGALDDDGEPREQWWHPPMARVPREQDRGLRDALCLLERTGATHSRWDNILGSEAGRQHYTMEIYDGNVRRAVARGLDEAVLMPACSWCGLPTGNFCDGFITMGYKRDDVRLRLRDNLYVVHECGAAVCSECEAVLGCCLSCAYFCGVPTQRASEVMGDAAGAAGGRPGP